MTVKAAGDLYVASSRTPQQFVANWNQIQLSRTELRILQHRTGKGMNERDSEKLAHLMKDPDFLELHGKLFKIHATLQLNGIIVTYIRDDTYFLVVNPGQNKSSIENLCSQLIKEATEIARRLSIHFPTKERWDWQERFIAYAINGDHDTTAITQYLYVASYLGDREAKRLAKLAEKYRKDEVLKASLQSFAEAQNDPNNELVHLYEIWEAIVRGFGNEKETLITLGISQNERRSFTALANSKPVRQGRHRGKHSPEELRDATVQELEKARSIAANIILAYLDYLEKVMPA